MHPEALGLKQNACTFGLICHGGAQANPLLEKGSDLAQLAGNETRLRELQALRDRKLYQPPGPGSYELQVCLCLEPSISNFDVTVVYPRRQGLMGIILLLMEIYQGDIKPVSYRRPESGGPKSQIGGKTMREMERERFDEFIHGGRDSPGPGYYNIARAKDQTQSRKLPQPVGANFRKGYTRRAECLSVAMLTGHHWRDLVPPLGEPDNT
eukprot:scaffold8997_cov45-Prasinocladus_malaysianus.AAC.1